jgi:hypothetical protein
MFTSAIKIWASLRTKEILLKRMSIVTVLSNPTCNVVAPGSLEPSLFGPGPRHFPGGIEVVLSGQHDTV